MSLIKTHLKEIYTNPYDKDIVTSIEEMSNQNTKESLYKSLIGSFENLYNIKAEIILRIPYIINLLGDFTTFSFNKKIITTSNEDIIILASKIEGNYTINDAYIRIEISELPSVNFKISLKSIIETNNYDNLLDGKSEAEVFYMNTAVIKFIIEAIKIFLE